jgi:predicted ATPase/DNA-binding SARP family transcriptional activator/predicted negative regulator of RcsB-dependent stress response
MVEVRVLGPVELIDGAAVVRLAPVERTLLAALAARIGERAAVEVLEDALWPEQRPSSARKTLQGHVMRLRRTMGASAIVEQSGGYRLDPEVVDVDARRIAGLLAEARDAIGHGEADQAVGLLRKAQTMFRGHPYADVPDAALPAGEVQRLQELYAAVVVEAFEAELTCGRGQHCVAELEAFLEREPYRERVWGQLMLALYQAGRPADALAAYGRARVVLAAELGLEPGPALRAIEQSILTHDARLLRNVVSRVALGVSNLPAALGPIVGRERELTDLERLCRDIRLVTLTGTGGVGKTRLAVELAARTSGRDQHGPFFVDLVPIADAELIPAALATALGVHVDPHDDVMERVRSALADRSIVVVVDNCEHLLPDVAELIAALVASSGGVRLVATSREPLDVAGERVCPLDPLGVPPDGSSPAQIRDSESATLFLARLPVNVAARPLNDAELDAVGEICRSLDGMPLGLELAAARSRTLSLPELAERLEHSISALTLPGHGVSPRHRSMRAALDWGYRLLSPSAQQALRAMSVFAGGCELPAFDAVCLEDGETALEVIDELVRTSFVVVDAATTPTRYRQLEPVRQFAAELLEATGAVAARRQRHLHFFRDLAHKLDERQNETGKAPLEPLLRELGNLRAALDWAAQDVDETDAGLSLAADMYSVWTGEAHHAEGVARIVALLGRGTGSPTARSKAACNAGIVAGHMGRSDQAIALCQQAVEEARRAGDEAQERFARLILAQCLIERGDLDAAGRHLALALPAGTEQTSEVDAICIITQAAWVDHTAGDLDAATARLERVVTGPYSTANWVGTAARACLGDLMLERGDHDRARSWLAAALALAETNDEPHVLVESHLGLVHVECAAGRLDEADAHFRVAARLRKDTHPRGDLPFLQARATLVLNSSSPGDAVALAAAALDRAKEVNSVVAQWASLRLLGDAQLATGDLDQAGATFERLIASTGAIPAPCRLAEGHEGAAAVSHVLADRDAAHRHLAAATEIRQRTGSRRLRRPGVEDHLVTLEAEQDDPKKGR